MITNRILMIRPVAFGFNEQTAVNNVFQQSQAQQGVAAKGAEEFDAMAALLRSKGVEVLVVDDTSDPHTPDSIFPNNWISFHGGQAILYPMFAHNRRQERKAHVLEALKEKYGVEVARDYSDFEEKEVFLEGTGSMVLDRDAKICYAALSQRTSEVLTKQWCLDNGYQPCVFDASDAQGLEIYHTNVLMCVTNKCVVICLEAVKDMSDLTHLIRTIDNSGKTTVEISLRQMEKFAGNMLQLQGKDKPLLVMSTQAYEALNEDQISVLSGESELVHSPLFTIEANGGGSARCMIAEVF